MAIENNYLSALQLFEDACDVGDSLSCYRAGMLIKNVESVRTGPRKMEDAFKYLKGSCSFVGTTMIVDIQSKTACFELIWFYEKGVTVAKDLEEAQRLASIVCDRNMGIVGDVACKSYKELGDQIDAEKK